jgi:hypothetical protein
MFQNPVRETRDKSAFPLPAKEDDKGIGENDAEKEVEKGPDDKQIDKKGYLSCFRVMRICDTLRVKSLLTYFKSRSTKASIRSIPTLKGVIYVAWAKKNRSLISLPTSVPAVPNLNSNLIVARFNPTETLIRLIRTSGYIHLVVVAVPSIQAIPAIVFIVIECCAPFSCHGISCKCESVSRTEE